MEKIARICWNTNGWVSPSGRDGKVLSSGNYENDKGFGHEEWLLDRSKIYKGYHYGYLECMNKTCHYDKEYDIHIFTINPQKQRVYIGCLRKAKGVGVKESKEVYKHYANKGWLRLMKEDVLNAKASVVEFNALKPEDLFNVKFKFDLAEIDLPNLRIIKRESIGHKYRYKSLMNKDFEFEFELNEKINRL